MSCWLVSLAGNPGFADASRAMRSFPGPAVYEADDEVQAWVESSGSKQLALVESDEQPAITTPPTDEPLRNLRGWEPSLVVPRGGRVLVSHLPDERIVLHPDPQPHGEQASRPLAHPCHYCDAVFPSKPALDRHAEMNH